MKLSLFTLAWILTSACFAQQNINATLNHQNTVREFIVHLPPNYSSSVNYPVVFVLHGGGFGTGQQVQKHSGFDAVADTAHFIAVYPTALNNNWADGRSNPSDDAGVDDIGFFIKMIDYLQVNYSVNARRLYSCGMSNGAFMSQKLAEKIGDKLAAIGAVAGSIGVENALIFNPIRPVPVVMINGTSDRMVPYNGGKVAVVRGECIPVDSVVKMWVNYNQCGATPTKTLVPNTNRFDLTTVEKYLYTKPGSSVDVLLYKVIRGGHAWPGTSSYVNFGETNQDINASVELWKFFKDKLSPIPVVYPFADATEIQTAPFPNPATKWVEISGESSVKPILQNFSGELLNPPMFFEQGRWKIDLSGQAFGKYVLSLKGKKFLLIHE